LEFALVKPGYSGGRVEIDGFFIDAEVTTSCKIL
jgi:hypothetical protein